MAETGLAAGFGRRGLMGGAAGLAMGGAFGTPVLAQGSRTLRVRFGSDISQLDPARIFQNENQSIASHIYNGLVQYDQRTNAIVPDLAESHEVSRDGTVWTFRLRQGVTWHKNYGALTSDDVKFSFDRVLDPATGSLYRGQLASVKEVQAPDPMTVRIVLNEANSGFLHKLCAFNQGWIVSRRAVTEIGERYSMNPIGTGPFVFDRWTTGNEVRLGREPPLFRGSLHAHRRDLPHRARRDRGRDRAREPRARHLLRAAVARRDRPAAPGAGVTVLDRPSNNTVNLVLNTTAGPLRDVRVRRAMMHAMNRKALIDGFFPRHEVRGDERADLDLPGVHRGRGAALRLRPGPRPRPAAGGECLQLPLRDHDGRPQSLRSLPPSRWRTTSSRSGSRRRSGCLSVAPMSKRAAAATCSPASPPWLGRPIPTARSSRSITPVPSAGAQHLPLRPRGRPAGRGGARARPRGAQGRLRPAAAPRRWKTFRSCRSMRTASSSRTARPCRASCRTASSR